jgi:hypothetical protein
MNNKRIVLAAIAGMTLLVGKTQQQYWNSLPGGNIINAGEYLGAAATSTVPLRFTTIPNLRQEWRTDNTLRMRLLETNTTQTIGSYLNQTVSGNLGVGQFTNPNVSLPFSLLHLDNGGSQYSGYRPWFRPGMTVTNSSDLGWIGLKNEGGDINHMTIAWADNTAVDGPDLFKVVFLANPGTTGTAGTLNGLETMRIRPLASGLQSFVGIGDFFTPGLNPTERLHILNGRVRIQQLPDDPEMPEPSAPAITKVLVVDDTPFPSPERGVVKWRDLANLNTDCDWTRDATTTFDVCTAFPGNSCPPDETKRVGVGVQHPKAKLQVYAHDPMLFGGDATLSVLQHDQFGGRGVSGAARSVFTSTFNPSDLTGVSGTAENGHFSIGVRGTAVNACASPGHSSIIAGVWG